MTYNVFSGTLNPTPLHFILQRYGDDAGNTIVENSSILSLIRMR